MVFFVAHRQRLVSVQSILSRPGRAQASRSGSSMEPELHQRQLFEYFLVVSLQKPKAGGHYLPEVTQQFPLKVKSTTPLTSKPAFHLMDLIETKVCSSAAGAALQVHEGD